MEKEKSKFNSLEKRATKFLSDKGYLTLLENIRTSPEYKEIVKQSKESLKKRTSKMALNAESISDEGYEAEVFARVKIYYSDFLKQTLSYNPPEEDVKSVMKIALISGNILDRAKEYSEQVSSSYVTQMLVDRLASLV